MNIAKNYIEGLKKAYIDMGQEEQWRHFEEIIQGAAQENINKLYNMFPEIPDSLINLLQFVDGTYWREYEGEEVAFYFLGSDLEEYPYYLLSSEEMMDTDEMHWLKDYVDREYGDMVEMDEKIIDNADEMHWLHFSDCMNNGGTSQLFIDFSPSEKGIKGQILRYLHDPDEIEVIADSFDEYLQMLIDNDFDFVGEEEEE